MAKKQGSLLPGEAYKRFTVSTESVMTKEMATTDGRSANEFSDLYVTVSYVGTMRRREGQFSLLLEWVDVDKAGHRVLLPHAVLERIISTHDTVMKEARSTRAKHAMQTRIEQGYVPTFSKKERGSDDTYN